MFRWWERVGGREGDWEREGRGGREGVSLPSNSSFLISSPVFRFFFYYFLAPSLSLFSLFMFSRNCCFVLFLFYFLSPSSFCCLVFFLFLTVFLFFLFHVSVRLCVFVFLSCDYLYYFASLAYYVISPQSCCFCFCLLFLFVLPALDCQHKQTSYYSLLLRFPHSSSSFSTVSSFLLSLFFLWQFYFFSLFIFLVPHAFTDLGNGWREAREGEERR